MVFLNPWLLLALAGTLIPVIVHLVRRQAAKPVEWGAMRFLLDTLSERRRRMEWEDLLLMAARCLLLALAAMAVARPILPPDGKTPWAVVLPAALLGIVVFGASFVAGSRRKRVVARVVAIAMLALATVMGVMEHRFNLRRFEAGGNRDVVIVLDASTSMTRTTGKRSLFDEALEEARRIITEAPRGTAFAVILGGPSPQALTATPVSHRADVLALLDGLQASGGSFRAREALGVATLVLAQGEHPNKDIVVLTDAQRRGWEFDNAGAWQAMEAAWKSLPAKPRVILHAIPGDPGLHNAGIASISGGRDLVGTDRPCPLRVTVANTGTVTVNPGAVDIEVDGKHAGREPLGLLVPGQSQILEFRHRFTTTGAHVVTARLSGNDGISGDDRADHVVLVRKAVRVVIIDGNPSAGFFERAAGHTALALAPAAAVRLGGQAGGDFLMDPVVIPAPELTRKDLDAADVVVLADVARLPAEMAAAVEDGTAAGAGLLVLAGPRVDPDYYNSWTGSDGEVLPIELGGEAGDPAGIQPAAHTFRHEAMAWAMDDRQSDLGGALIRRWRQATVRPGQGMLAAAFGNGAPFIVTRGYGRGRCAVVTCAFDARSGNLPGRAAFVPLVHELVAWTAGGGVNWNIDPAWSPTVALDTRSSGGLAARYARRDGNGEKIVLERIDPSIDFNWDNRAPVDKLPADNFVVHWRATLLPRVSGEYLIDADVDDRVSVKLAGRMILEQKREDATRTARVNLEAGKPVAVEVDFIEEGGQARVRLNWTPPGGKRQCIPSSAWMPPAGDKPIEFTALDPTGRTRKASVQPGRRGRDLQIEGPAIPGLYQIQATPALRGMLPGLAADTPIPLVVRAEIGESQADPMTPEDHAQLRARTGMVEAKSADDVLAVLSGRGLGREITRMVALAALVMLVLEATLARWVSRSRRSGDDLAVTFGEATPDFFGKGGMR